MMNRKELIKKLNRPIVWVAIFASWITIFLLSVVETDLKSVVDIAIIVLFLIVVIFIEIMLTLSILDKSK